jgi:rare lipoprotein A
MADGRKFNPSANVAASKTLPLGTTAKVVNLATGKSATVKVEDKGPYVAGRVMDVSPKVANDLGMTKSGVAPVAVKPVAVPLPDGEVKLGAGAADMPQQEVSQAVRATKQLVPDRR